MCVFVSVGFRWAVRGLDKVRGLLDPKVPLWPLFHLCRVSVLSGCLVEMRNLLQHHTHTHTPEAQPTSQATHLRFRLIDMWPSPAGKRDSGDIYTARLRQTRLKQSGGKFFGMIKCRPDFKDGFISSPAALEQIFNHSLMFFYN